LFQPYLGGLFEYGQNLPEIKKKKKKLFMAFDRHYCKQHLPNKDSPSNYWLVAAANAAAINGQRANY
jgi:hypothetical protein